MISNNQEFFDLTNISGLEEIDDSVAECLTAGAFRFAVSSEFDDTARKVEFVSGTTTTQDVLIDDEFVRLNDRNGAGSRFAIAIHDANTGQNLAQLRSADNPARSGELIRVDDVLSFLISIAPVRPYEYRVRQF